MSSLLELISSKFSTPKKKEFESPPPHTQGQNSLSSYGSQTRLPTPPPPPPPPPPSSPSVEDDQYVEVIPCQSCSVLQKQHQDLASDLNKKINEKDSDIKRLKTTIEMLKNCKNEIIQLNEKVQYLEQENNQIKKTNMQYIEQFNQLYASMISHKNLATQYGQTIEEKSRMIEDLQSSIQSSRATANEQMAIEFRQNNNQASILSTKRPMLDKFAESYLIFIDQYIAPFMNVVPMSINDRTVAFMVQQIFKGCLELCNKVIHDPLSPITQNMTTQGKQTMENSYFEIIGGMDPKTIVPYQKAYKEFCFIHQILSIDGSQNNDVNTLIDGCCNLAWRILLTQPSIEFGCEPKPCETFNKNSHTTFPGLEPLERGFVDLCVIPQIVTVKDKTQVTKALVFLADSQNEVTSNQKLGPSKLQNLLSSQNNQNNNNNTTNINNNINNRNNTGPSVSMTKNHSSIPEQTTTSTTKTSNSGLSKDSSTFVPKSNLKNWTKMDIDDGKKKESRSIPDSPVVGEEKTKLPTAKVMSSTSVVSTAKVVPKTAINTKKPVSSRHFNNDNHGHHLVYFKFIIKVKSSFFYYQFQQQQKQQLLPPINDDKEKRQPFIGCDKEIVKLAKICTDVRHVISCDGESCYSCCHDLSNVWVWQDNTLQEREDLANQVKEQLANTDFHDHVDYFNIHQSKALLL
ncbi:hypothetical protein DFA_02410 [Cavenderia fasciculata]|uniref:Uncharacterized protein n=1 Tax=Cavenderia fasciculata TaxID=261658 RepID=F4PZD3_CACFS|nr:uncharacterized protein DFA_02410 [Cavenderia fasciculata]EGG19162.1 hypothetical protein DFA_02410 [Cavenderia fasciculata]|eukprot:XP_004366795.1 hypothetical protein DFA_02410 [Cavenderia fasciculata]